MKFHKTNQSERGVYRYPVDVPDGKGGYVRTYNVIRPGENGVTEADIATLHRIDDNEVNNNIRNSKPKISETDKIAVRNWREKFVFDFKAKYGYEPNSEDIAYFQEKAFPKNWSVSIDVSADDGIDDDKSRVCAESAYEPDYDTNLDYQRVLEIVSLLNEEQQEIFRRVFINGESQAAVARSMGIENRQSLTKRIARIKEQIKKKF